MTSSALNARWQMLSEQALKQEERKERERAIRRGIRGSLAEWARLALAPQGFAPAPHHLLLIRELEAVAAGTTDRLMVLMPPGSAKSTYASLVFPPWFLHRHPRAQVIAASHTAGLAVGFGRGVRGLIQEHQARLGVSVDPGSRAAHRFGTAGGGAYYGVGMRGPVTGRRADLIVVDDPVKGQLEADSPRVRDAVWDWYRSDLVTRLRPGGRVVLVMTRWHPDDLGGRLLEAGEPWRVVRLPALAEPGDLLGRAPGEALWPDWEDAAALERKRLILGDRAFAALFQQSPVRSGGGLFQVGRIPVSDEVLAGTSVRAWDLAATEGGGDWTVGVRLVRGEAQGIPVWQVLDVVRLQGGPEAVVQAIRRTAEADGTGVAVGLPQDPGQAGRAQVGYLTARLAGWRVVSSPETGAKAVRAMPVASQANAGNVQVLRAPWTRAFLDEMQAFPAGKCDDQVDALARAFAMLVDPAPAARAVRMDWGRR